MNWLTVCLVIIMFASFAMLFKEGIWSNTVTFFNLLCSSLFATAFFEPVATWLETKMPSYTFLLDFLVIWGLFVISFSIMRTVTDMISKYRVHFPQPVGPIVWVYRAVVFLMFFLLGWMMFNLVIGLVIGAIGAGASETSEDGPSVAMACITSWVIVCFTCATLHMAPLPRNFLGGWFQPSPNPEVKMFFGTAPDRKWFGFVQQVSQGSLLGEKKFDLQGELIYKYAERRLQIEKSPSIRVNR